MKSRDSDRTPAFRKRFLQKEADVMTNQELDLITGMAVATYVCRYPVLALVSRITLPSSLLGAMRFIPPAVLAAIITPAVLMPEGNVAVTAENEHFIAGLVAVLVAWRSQNLLLTIVVGMITLWALRWLAAV
jgi:branched-subunit amino acid transport protein